MTIVKSLGAQAAARGLVAYLRPGDVAEAVLANQAARDVVKEYQGLMGGLQTDGYPGSKTRARAELLIGSPQEWPEDIMAAWPDPITPVPLVTPVPGRVPLNPMSLHEKFSDFGQFTFTYNPQLNNPEKIQISSPWPERNISSVVIPQLDVRFGKRVLVLLNIKVQQQFLAFFSALDRRGLMPLISSFNGSWSARFVRQNGTLAEREAICRDFGTGDAALPHVSAHAWGIAIDMDFSKYPLNVPLKPADPWWQVVACANEFGLASGADFVHRPDSGHFEVAKILP